MNQIDPVRCRRCSRPLHTPDAVAAEYGPACALRVLHEAAQQPQEPATEGGEALCPAR